MNSRFLFEETLLGNVIFVWGNKPAGGIYSAKEMNPAGEEDYVRVFTLLEK